MKLLTRINTVIGNLETAFLCLIVLLMIGMGFLKIVLRTVFHISLQWNEVMLQHFTLWLAFLGAALATAKKRHISIDVLTRFLPERFRRLAGILTNVLSFIVIAILIDASIEFVRFEQMSEAALFGAVPAWWGKLIIPIGFVLIALHLLIHIVIGIISSVKKTEIKD